MCLRQIFSIGSLPFKKIGYGIQPEAINAHAAPIVQNFEDFFLNHWIVVIEIGLMMKEAVPIILLRQLDPTSS